MSVTLHNSPSFDTAQPKLSVLIPFYQDDPVALLKTLPSLPDVEVLIYDDGTNHAELSARVSDAVAASPASAQLITNTINKGRSAARNALQAAARAPWVLFLDADMRPARPDFLSNYLRLIETSDADAIFGGFEVEASAADRDRDLHRALSEISDCLSLAERQAAGPQYVASSNLCVRKDVLDREPFDPEFSGWGWEDSEWAARIAKSYTLLHADIPAVHLGLETTDTLLRRFATSGANYQRFTELHPDLAPSLALYRISQKLRRLPGQKVMRPVLRTLVRAQALPVRVRLSALKLWRASHYAETLS